MDSGHETIRSALKFFSGETENVCRLCFEVMDRQEISMDDYAMLQKPYYDNNIAFVDMLKELGVNAQASLPQALCSNCATAVSDSYLFKKFCEYSDEKWNMVVRILAKSLNQAESIGHNVLSAYLIVNNNDNVVLTSRKRHTTKTKKNVLIKIKNIQKNRQKYSKLKKKSGQIQCEDCGDKFKSTYLLTKHSTNVHNKTSYPCTQCTKVFATAIQLEGHNERVHDPKKIKCTKCTKMFSSVKLLNYHDRLHHTATVCKLCHKHFPSKRDLRSHLDRHDINKCPKCGKSFKNKNTFRYHLKACGDCDHRQRRYFCDMCGKGYVQKNGLKTHLRIDHGFGHVLSCNWCGKKFEAISRLNNHIVKHTKERKFICGECGGRFVTAAALVYHSRLHTGERPFQCDMCDESFLSASRRMEHKHRKHFEPTKECPVCHVKFVTRNQLRKHVYRHYNPHSKLYAPEAAGSQLLDHEAIVKITENFNFKNNELKFMS